MGVGRRGGSAAATVLVFGLTVGVGLAPPAAAAGSCIFDPTAGTVSVTLAPAPPATTLSRTARGAITIDGSRCGAATVHNTDTISLTGTVQDTEILVVDLRNGPLAPGREPEPGSREIEVFIDLGVGDGGMVKVVAGDGNDSIAGATAALDLDASDVVPDDDLFFAAPNDLFLHVYGEGGHDSIDLGPLTTLSASGFGGPGDDSLVGGSGHNSDLYGDHAFGDHFLAPSGAGADTLTGGASEFAHFRGGPGDDVMVAGPKGAFFHAEPTIDGSDIMLGSPTADAVSYSLRNAAVEVTLDGMANDGDPSGSGEGDLVGSDIESVQGGRGDDVLIAGAGRAFIFGDLGNDRIVGGDGNDTLGGSYGDDWVEGGGGDDFVHGFFGNDSLQGGPGADTIHGNAGDDQLTGGDGTDALYGHQGADRFAAFDLQPDLVDGGSDLDIDLCECDPFDTMTNIP